MIELPPWAVASASRVEHIGRVAELLEGWAAARGVSGAEAVRWRRAAVLHDALKDAAPDELARWTPQGDWPLALWHGPAAAAAAAAAGETDPGVLSAVRYHSAGFAGWDDVGRALYLADYLEPGRRHDAPRRAAWAQRAAGSFDEVLREVAAVRVGWLIAQGRPLMQETWAFWNRIASAAPPRS